MFDQTESNNYRLNYSTSRKKEKNSRKNFILCMIQQKHTVCIKMTTK